VPKPKNPRKPKPLYKQKPPPGRGLSQAAAVTETPPRFKPAGAAHALRVGTARAPEDFVQATPIIPAHFELREDGSILDCGDTSPLSKAQTRLRTPNLIFHSDILFVRLYHGNSLELLDAIAAKYPEGRFDAIFADPPYFLSNGGISCHAGKMVKVDKSDWDKSRGPELNHEFNTEWLWRGQRVLKSNGTIWVWRLASAVAPSGAESV
jgi:hypothetical protein